MHKLIIIGILFLVVVQPAVSQSRKKAPDWVFNSPGDGLYYYGIGSCPMDKDVDYRKVARENAIREIAEKLLVRISSNSSLQTTASSKSYDYHENSNIRTQTLSNFQDVRLDEDWVDDAHDTYYALYKLDIDQYRQTRKEYMDLVLNTFQDYVDRSEAEFAEGNYTLWLRNLTEAMHTIGADMNSLVELEYSSRLKSAQFDLEKSLRDHMYALKLVSDRTTYSFDPLSGQPTRVYLQVNNKQYDPDHQEEIPLKIKELRGDVFYSKFLRTENGMALDLYGLLPDQGEVDLQLLMDLPDELKSVFHDSYPLLEVPVKVRFEPFFMQVTATEAVNGQVGDSPFVANFFSEFLSRCSIYEASPGDIPAYHLMVHSVITPIRSDYGKSKAVAIKMDLKIVEGVDGSTVFSKELTNSRGYGNTYQQAVKSAYDQFAQSSDSVLNEMIQVLCSKQPKF